MKNYPNPVCNNLLLHNHMTKDYQNCKKPMPTYKKTTNHLSKR